jgi:2-keto-4-pentenoate hydratase
MDANARDRAATELLEMRRSGRIVADLPPGLRPSTLAEAYAVQRRVVDGLLAEGERCIGYKVACTNVIAQQALRIDRPVFGRLLSHTTSTSPSTLTAADFTHRVIEAEFGFLIGRDVEPTADGSPHTIESIAQYIEALVPAIEVVDYRYESWTVGALQVACDNAIHGWWVVGEPVTDWQGHDLADAPVSVTRAGLPVTSGSGQAVLGNPLNVMAWLADELPRFGERLTAGDYVTTGVTTDVFEAAAGDLLVADFAAFGTVELRFGESPPAP